MFLSFRNRGLAKTWNQVSDCALLLEGLVLKFLLEKYIRLSSDAQNYFKQIKISVEFLRSYLHPKCLIPKFQAAISRHSSNS